MNYEPQLVTPPTSLPLTLAQAQEHVREFDPDRAAYLTDLIRAATAHLDGWSGILGQAILPQTWEQGFSGWAGCLALPMPARSVAQVSYLDNAGQSQLISPSFWRLVNASRGSEVAFLSTFSAPALLAGPGPLVTVRFEAGFPDGAPQLEAVRAVIRMMIGHWYENREAVVTGVSASELPLSVQAVLTPLRRLGA